MENASEEYLRAQHLGQKEKKKLEAAGKSPYPPAFEEEFPEAVSYAAHDLPVCEVPADRIVGTFSKSRMNAFSASFYPLPAPDSEFAMKWIALCRAHLSDTGINDPIECVEYLGNFYVKEGNKRTSVFKYFGVLRVPAKVRRILPPDRNDPRFAAYGEFLEFNRATGLYDVQYRHKGDYAKLLTALGKKQGEEWESAEIRRFSSFCTRFKEAYAQLEEEQNGILPEEAMLLFFRIYTYDQADRMDQQELKKALLTVREDLRASAEPEALTVRTEPAKEERKGVIGKLITGAPKHLNAAFIYQRDCETSPWTSGHAQGAREAAKALDGALRVSDYFGADDRDAQATLIEQAIADGADVVFTTTPPMLHSTLKAAVAHPKVAFFNCSACQPLSSVRSYYCRTYEGKFITGLIAGALSDNDLIGYVGSYPILGVPAAINAFALGARMTNPRARILLEWSCLEGDPAAALRARGARVISNRDIPLPDLRCMEDGVYGTVRFDDEGRPSPVASPCWMWGKLYEKILRSLLNKSIEKPRRGAVNYWWGMDSGVIDVKMSSDLPQGVRRLAEHFAGRIRARRFDPFAQKLTTADGRIICDGVRAPTSLELLQCDALCDAVEGRVPTYGELLPMSRELVRELLLPSMALPAESEETP